MSAVLVVLLGGMVGAPVRYLVDRWVRARHGSAFPWGTWLVNVVGTFLLGFVAAGAVAGAVPAAVVAVVGSGFCGALTTYSTFAYETFRLIGTGAWLHAVGYLLASVAAGLVAAVAGAAVAIVVWG